MTQNLPEPALPEPALPEPALPGPALPEPALRDWLRAQIAGYLDLAPAEIADDVPLAAYGVDSVYALAILADIEERLELALDPELIWDYPTIGALSAFLHADRRYA
jgi:acyl carrier protein